MFRKTSSVVSLASYGLLAILAFSFLAGCQTAKRHWPAMTGQVLDAETDEPIQDAIVLANWQGVVSFSNTRCFYQVRDITDAQGRFTIPAWENQASTARSSNQHIHIKAHKYGYRRSEKTYRTKSYRKNIYYLERDDAIAIERLRYLRHVISGSGCGVPKSEAKHQLLPLYSSVYKEAYKLASNSEEQEILSDIQAMITWKWREADSVPPWGPAQFDAYFNEHIREELLQ